MCLRDKPPKHLALQADKAQAHETHSLQQTEKPFLKGLHSDSPTVGPNTETTIGKVPRVCERGLFAYFKTLA